MISLRRVAAGRAHLGGLLGNRCTGTSHISSWGSAAGKPYGNTLDFWCARCHLVKLDLCGTHMQTAPAQGICGSTNTVCLHSNEPSEQQLFSRFPASCRRCITRARSIASNLHWKYSTKCSVADVVSGHLVPGSPLSGADSVMTCRQSLVASEECGGRFRVQLGCELPFRAGRQPPLRFGRQPSAVPESGVKAADGADLIVSVHPSGVPTVCSLREASQLGTEHLSLGHFTRPSGAEGEHLYGAGSAPIIAIAIGTAIVIPLGREQESDTNAEGEMTTAAGAVRPVGFRANGSAAGCSLEGKCTLFHIPSQWRPLFYADVLFGATAEALRQHFGDLKRRAAGDSDCRSIGFSDCGSAVSACRSNGGSDRLERNLQFLLGRLQARLTALVSSISRPLETIRLPAKRANALRNGGIQLATSEAAQGIVELQVPCHRQSICNEAATGGAESDGDFSTNAGRRDHTTQLAVHTACQTGMRQGFGEAASCSADAGLPRGQPKPLAAHSADRHPDGAGQTVGWWAALASAIGLFLRTLASVCQRLLFVVPLALAATTAGLGLLTLPYVSAGLQMVGLGEQRVLGWEAVVHRELEEVIFTAVTAAASAAGPTYVKFLQVIRCTALRTFIQQRYSFYCC